MPENMDVLPDPSPGESDDELLAGIDDSPDPAPGSEGSDDPGKRTPENIYREFARKFEKQQSEMREFQQGLLNSFNSALATLRPTEPAKPTGNPLDAMSIDQLKSARSQIKPESKEAFEEYLQERIINDRVEHGISRVTGNLQAKEQRSRFNQEATTRFPELTNRTSPFRRAVDAKVQEWGEEAAKDPRIVLNAANEVAIEMGVQPAVRRRVPATPPGTGKPVGGATPTPTTRLSKEEHEQIAKRLQGALPKGKKFDQKRIAERTAQYEQNIALHVRG